MNLSHTVRHALRGAAAVFALALGAAACDRAPTEPAAVSGARRSAAPAPAAEIDVHEGMLRWMLDNKSMTGVDARCVSTHYPDDVDASPELLARFSAEQPPVVPLSQCTISVSGDIYNPTGGFAQWFFLGPVTFKGKGAELESGFHFNGRLFERQRCSLRQTGTGWSVSSCTLVAAG